MPMTRIRKAVFPVAGLGTRFLPATKASPKEMLPVVDKPLIQYAVEEAVQAGVEVLVFVTSRTKRSIEDHFDSAYELETELALRGKQEQLALVRGIVPKHVSCVYIRQAEALGLGHAVLCAEPAVGNEPFFVILADDLIDGGERSSLQQMAGVFAEKQSSMVGIEKVRPEETNRYGIIKPAGSTARLHQVQDIVEKPAPKDAPSTLGVVGRYILTPRIFTLLKETKRGAGGEIQLTDGIAALLATGAVHGVEFTGELIDVGTPAGWLATNARLALEDPALGAALRTAMDMVSA